MPLRAHPLPILLAISAFLAPASAPAQETPPNILLVFADDIGYEALGSYGGLDFETPHLDHLAEEGIRFSRAYTSPVCTPSRVSLHTGLHTFRHGHRGVLPVHKGTEKKVDFTAMPTFAQVLREAGYRTSTTGKWQLATLEAWPDHIRRAGFDSWCIWQIWRDGKKQPRHWNATYNEDGAVRTDIADRFGPDVLVDYVIEQMTEARDAGEPFLIVHNELLPHYPMVETPLDRKLGREASLGHLIEYLDVLVGRLVAAVDDLGIADDTWIVFMGDNGTEERFFANPRRGVPGEKPHTRHTTAGPVDGGKNQLNDAGAHVPLLARGPHGSPKGVVRDELVDVVDLFPTFCELAGAPLPDDLALDGRSLAPAFHGQPIELREWTHQGLPSDQTLFDGEWRLFHRSGKLVDLRELPDETVVKEVSSESRAARERLDAVFQRLHGSR